MRDADELRQVRIATLMQCAMIAEAHMLLDFYVAPAPQEVEAAKKMRDAIAGSIRRLIEAESYNYGGPK